MKLSKLEVIDLGFDDIFKNYGLKAGIDLYTLGKLRVRILNTLLNPYELGSSELSPGFEVITHIFGITQGEETKLILEEAIQYTVEKYHIDRFISHNLINETSEELFYVGGNDE